MVVGRGMLRDDGRCFLAALSSSSVPVASCPCWSWLVKKASHSCSFVTWATIWRVIQQEMSRMAHSFRCGPRDAQRDRRCLRPSHQEEANNACSNFEAVEGEAA